MKARRNGDWQGLVPVGKAKKHLKSLGHHEAVARIAGIHRLVITRIIHGHIAQIRKSTEDAILSVTERDIRKLWPQLAHDGSFLPAEPIKEMVAELKRSGFSEVALGRKVSLKTGLRVVGKKYVRAFNARRIEQIYRKAGVAA